LQSNNEPISAISKKKRKKGKVEKKRTDLLGGQFDLVGQDKVDSELGGNRSGDRRARLHECQWVFGGSMLGATFFQAVIKSWWAASVAVAGVLSANPRLPATAPLPPTLTEETDGLSREHNARRPSMMIIAYKPFCIKPYRASKTLKPFCIKPCRASKTLKPFCSSFDLSSLSLGWELLGICFDHFRCYRLQFF
jgi:hypothetical protein